MLDTMNQIPKQEAAELVKKLLLDGKSIRQIQREQGLPKKFIEDISKEVPRPSPPRPIHSSPTHIKLQKSTSKEQRENKTIEPMVGKHKEVVDRLINIAHSKGYKVLINGFPDLLLYNNDFTKIFAIEVKTSKDSLRAEQIETIGILRRAGISTHVSLGDWYEPVEIGTTTSNLSNALLESISQNIDKQKILDEIFEFFIENKEIYAIFNQWIKQRKTKEAEVK